MKKLSAARWALLLIPVAIAADALAISLGSRFAARYLYFACVPGIVAGFGWDNDFGWPAWPFALAALLMAGWYFLCWLHDWRKAFLGCFIADAVISVGMGAMFLSRAEPFILTFWIPVVFHAIGFALLGISLKRKK